jgi:uncharacterized protein YjbI with pentapeptide repeats
MLAYAVFRGADLRAASLLRAEVNAASFSAADLRGADLTAIYARDADFSWADLRACRLDQMTSVVRVCSTLV